MTDRTIEPIDPQAVRFKARRCDYVSKNPYRTCSEVPAFVVTTRSKPSEKRRSMTFVRWVCEKHLPRERRPASEPPQTGMISAQEAAEVIGLPVMTLHQWRRRGRGPAWTKVRSRYWYDRAEVERFAEAYWIVKGGHP